MGRKKKTEYKVTSDVKRKPMVVCQFCGKTEKETRFYRAKNPKYQYFGKIPWCPECIKNEYERLLKKYENSEKAMYELCRYLDMFFSKKIFEIAKKRWEESGVEIFQGYITYYNSVGGKNAGVTFMESDFVEDYSKMTITPEEKEILGEEHEQILDNYIKDWGRGFTLEQYEYLEYELSKCKMTLKCDTWSEDTLLKEICIKKLEIRDKREKKEETKDDIKDLQNLMKTCAVDPAKTSLANSSKALDAFGVWIKDIEEKNPAEWYKDKKKFKDVDGIDDYLKKYIMRPIKNFITGSRDFNVDKDVMVDFDSDGDK